MEINWHKSYNKYLSLTFLAGLIFAIIAVWITILTMGKDISLMGMIRGFFYHLLKDREPWEKIFIVSLLVGLGNALFIPINLLLFLTAFYLPGWYSFTANMLGSQIAALLGYFYGSMISGNYLKDKLGKYYTIIRREVSRDALKAMVLLSIAPITPSIVTNILMGICRIPVWKLLCGSFIGFLPGVTILTLLGRQARHILEDPSIQTYILIASLLGLIFISYRIGTRIKLRLLADAEDELTNKA